VSGTSLKYTVSSPVSVPAGTTIRLEIARIIATAAGSFTVSIKTLDTGGGTIDGPTTTGSFIIKSITGNDISKSFMVRKTLNDDTAGHAHGWNRDGMTRFFTISDSDADKFTIDCGTSLNELLMLHYMIITLPSQVVTSSLSVSSSSPSSAHSSQYESLRAHDQIASEFP
jgi:hypothetical protein